MSGITFQKNSDAGLIKPKRSRKPNLYNLVVFNDDVTTVRQAVRLLSKHFNIDQAKALQIANVVHNKGSAVFSGESYSLEVAESKAENIMDDARKYYGSPLNVDVQRVRI